MVARRSGSELEFLQQSAIPLVVFSGDGIVMEIVHTGILNHTVSTSGQVPDHTLLRAIDKYNRGLCSAAQALSPIGCSQLKFAIHHRIDNIAT